MLTPKRMLLVVAALALSQPARAAAQSAPASIGNTLVEFLSFTDSTSSDEMVLFRSDGTYQDLRYSATAFGNGGTQPPASGTYTYAPSSSDPTSGVIAITSGGAAIAGGTIRFVSPSGGYSSSPGGTFTFWPGVAPAGAANVSTRSFISTAHPMEAGFVIEGSVGRWVLVRGAGPSLAQFGVSDGLANPGVTVFSNGTARGTLSPWNSDPNLVPGYNALFSLAGAFQFTSGSSDCAGIMFLPPGAYVAQGSTPGPSGEILAEVYILPFGS
jgi:hypothetical protein